MPRQSRAHSTSGVYHVMMRGNEKRDIFIDNEDREKFLGILYDKKLTSEYQLYSYCLMRNHIHLLLKENTEEISLCLKRINISYAYYFNKKYSRVGHLFQDRFKSECIDTEEYLLGALRYIHNNPVKACIVSKSGDYFWSSYNCYARGRDDLLTDRSEILPLFSNDINNSVKLFIAFSKKENDDEFIDIDADDEVEIKGLCSARKFIDDYLKNKSIKLEDLKDKCNLYYRDNIILLLKDNSNLSQNEIGSLLGLGRKVIRGVK